MTTEEELEMNKNETIFYDGRNIEKVAKRLQECKPGNTVVVKPENVDFSTLPKFPYYQY